MSQGSNPFGNWPPAAPACIRCGARWPSATYRAKGLCVSCYINASRAGILVHFSQLPEELEASSLALAAQAPVRYLAKFLGRSYARGLFEAEARQRADELVIRAMLRWQGLDDSPLDHEGGPHA